MRTRTWITREEIAEIHDARADKALDTAANRGGPDDIGHVVKYLAIEAKLRNQAADVRSIERLFGPVGTRSA